jgi:hypothetical protein
MNRKEYQQYESRVRSFMQAEGIRNLTRDMDAENHFSWSPCDCCERPLGGDRMDASGYNPETKEIYKYQICPDCEYYAEYGCLDDMTMMDLDK